MCFINLEISKFVKSCHTKKLQDLMCSSVTISYIKHFTFYYTFYQAYREAFEYLIENFKTYRPLLAGVKNEYEMMLAYQRQQIRELEPLRVSVLQLGDRSYKNISPVKRHS